MDDSRLRALAVLFEIGNGCLLRLLRDSEIKITLRKKSKAMAILQYVYQQHVEGRSHCQSQRNSIKLVRYKITITERTHPPPTSAAASMTDALRQPRPPILGIHHIKFAVSSLDVSLAWYERVVGAKRIPHLDHIRSDGTRFAVVCEMPEWSGLYLELRQTSDQALKERGWDPVTLSVQGREDLVRWIAWLERWQTVHSPLLTGVRGWLLVFEVCGYSHFD